MTSSKSESYGVPSSRSASETETVGFCGGNHLKTFHSFSAREKDGVNGWCGEDGD